jgi:hypothetical protein
MNIGDVFPMGQRQGCKKVVIQAVIVVCFVVVLVGERTFKEEREVQQLFVIQQISIHSTVGSEN